MSEQKFPAPATDYRVYFLAHVDGYDIWWERQPSSKSEYLVNRARTRTLTSYVWVAPDKTILDMMVRRGFFNDDVATFIQAHHTLVKS